MNNVPIFTANDIDGAYLLGVFNASGIDGLADELKRLKELGRKPHEIIILLKPEPPPSPIGGKE